MAKLAIRGGRPVARKPALCPWPIADARDGKVLLQALMNPAGWCRLGVKGRKNVVEGRRSSAAPPALCEERKEARAWGSPGSPS